MAPLLPFPVPRDLLRMPAREEGLDQAKARPRPRLRNFESVPKFAQGSEGPIRDGSVLSMIAADDRPALTQIIVAVPVRNEAKRLPQLLRALAASAMRSPVGVTVILLANNCTDHSTDIIRSFVHPSLRLELHEIEFADAHAGVARRKAMDLAARAGALILTTDGDAAPDPHWIAAALSAAHSGADVVCGRIDADCRHVLATSTGRRVTAAEAAYANLQHELRHAIDVLTARQGAQRPHYIESGASLAIRADCYQAIGGLPWVRSSEDRALVHRAEVHGLTVRYAEEMKATVSGRLHGRAEGGMAEALRHRMQDEDPLADQSMLPVHLLADLWDRAVGGCILPFPSRARPVGLRLRASDLEAGLPALEGLVKETVRPQLLLHQEQAA